MLLSPVAFVSTGIFCLFTRFCVRNCCDSSNSNDSANDSVCFFGCCPQVFETHIPEEELRIPVRQPMTFYSSISLENTTNSFFSSDYNDSDSTTVTEFDPLSAGSDLKAVNYRATPPNHQEEDVVDIQIPLIVNSSDDEEKSEPYSPMSPPDLLLLTGDDAVKGYSAFLKNSAKASQGPNVVDVNQLKSKSFASLNDDNENSSMDDFDANYSQRYREFLEKNNISNCQEAIGRTNSSEKRVQFNSMTDVRSFKIER